MPTILTANTENVYFLPEINPDAVKEVAVYGPVYCTQFALLVAPNP